MRATKIYIKELKKSFNVRHTNKMMRLSYEFQLEMAKLGQLSDNAEIDDQFKAMTKYSHTLIDFPVQILNLNEDDENKLDEMDQEELQKLDVRIALTVQGLSKREIDNTLNAMDESEQSDNKSDKEEEND
ncbi:phage tail assembly chaperone [Limosilactobacillus reuteri]|uniref:phage tail assembly chaperone n=1 Tax=Limosilactobacillus reuteri TaxID=1598 RepID=UPI001E35486C|nr:phage tail assembly chaperone [Limosilactobacillus reuteri]MCC4501831.1 phage tail assembly chaperone [Limosilactobacillus reuteri]